MRNISNRFYTLKDLDIGKTKGTVYVKTFNFVYQGPLVFPISYSFIVKKRLEIERRKTCGPYCTSQFLTLFFILCAQWLLLEIFVRKVFEPNLNFSLQVLPKIFFKIKRLLEYFSKWRFSRENYFKAQNRSSTQSEQSLIGSWFFV